MTEAANNFSGQDLVIVEKQASIRTNLDEHGVSTMTLTDSLEEDIPTATSLDLDIDSVLKTLNYKGTESIVKKDKAGHYSIAGIEIKDNTVITKH